jgi:amidase
LKTGDSENNIFGRTLNPHRLALTAGGSSGGEGALVALRGSLLGVGTDIAGSVRIPAQCDGTYGFKPSSARIPYGGQTTPSRAGSPGFLPSAGPLTNSFRDMELFCRAVISAQPQNVDSSCLGIPWRDVPTKERLVIGVLGEDPSLPLHPPVSRACSSAVSKLTAAGHNVKFLKNTPPLSAASRLSFAYFSLDSRNTRIQHILCSGEPRVNSVKNTAPQYPGRIPTVDELYDMNVERAKLIAEWDKIYLDNELDAIVGPGAPSTAVPHDTLRPPGYTMLWNLLDVRQNALMVDTTDIRAC